MMKSQAAATGYPLEPVIGLAKARPVVGYDGLVES